MLLHGGWFMLRAGRRCAPRLQEARFETAFWRTRLGLAWSIQRHVA